jgi:hypothetical protein
VYALCIGDDNMETNDKRIIEKEDRLFHLYEMGILTWIEVIEALDKYLRILGY